MECSYQDGKERKGCGSFIVMPPGDLVMGRKKTGKKLPCLECLHCKTRTFIGVTELRDWCGRKAIKPNKTWVEDVVDLGWIRLMWCEMQTSQHSHHGLSPRNASPKYTTKFSDVLEAEKSEVVVTNQNRMTFITGAGDVCPYFLS